MGRSGALGCSLLVNISIAVCEGGMQEQAPDEDNFDMFVGQRRNVDHAVSLVNNNFWCHHECTVTAIFEIRDMPPGPGQVRIHQNQFYFPVSSLGHQPNQPT
jgi:hypothetical protein